MGKKNIKKQDNQQLFEEEQDTDIVSEQSDRPSKKQRGKTKKKKKQGKKQKEKQVNLSKSEVWVIYKKFFAYSLNRWDWGLACIIVTLVSGFFQSIFPLKLGQFLDLVSNQTRQNSDTSYEEFKQKLTYQMILLGSLTVLIGICIFSRHMILQLFQQKLAIDLKCEIYNIFIQNDLNFFELHQSNALVSRLSTDINQAKSAISNNLTMLLRNIIMCISSFIILMKMSWRCTLIMVLIILPIFSYVTLVYKKKAKQLIKKRQDIKAKISVHVGEKFSGIQTIKAYGTQKKQMKKYQKLNMKVYQLNKKRAVYQGILSTCSNFLPSLGQLLVLLYTGVRLLNGTPQLTAGELTSFILYCTTLSSSASSISNSYTNIINGTSAIQKVFEMMNYEKLIEENIGQKVDIDGSIQFNAVDFIYPSHHNKSENPVKQEKNKNEEESELEEMDSQQTASNLYMMDEMIVQRSNQDKVRKTFNKLSFKINKGEYVGFVGQSGSGKSTIFKLIQHFYNIQGGDILFGDYNSKDINIKHLRKQIGVVSQDTTIFSGTIEENIAYGLKDYTHNQLEAAAQKAGCLQFINNPNIFPNGFDTIVGERGSKISGGQRQRISIARALLRNPKLLLFDEATSALDSHSQEIVKNSIQQLATQKQLTILVIAHRLSTVRNCQKLYVMKEGQIIEVGNHQELIRKKGYYYTLVEKQLNEIGHKYQDIVEEELQDIFQKATK